MSIPSTDLIDEQARSAKSKRRRKKSKRDGRRRRDAAASPPPSTETSDADAAVVAASPKRSAGRFRAAVARAFDELLAAGTPTSLHWSLSQDSPSSEVLSLAAGLARRKKASGRRAIEKLEAWLAEPSPETPSVAWSLDCLAWSHFLPMLADERLASPASTGDETTGAESADLSRGGSAESPSPADRLIERLTAVARDAAALDGASHPVVHQLLAGELALRLALLADDRSADDLLTESCAVMAKGMDALLDGDGVPHATDLPSLRMLFACWTRAALLGKRTGVRVFTGDARNHYAWVVRQAIRFTRTDAASVLDADHGAFSSELFEAALDLAGDAADRAMAACVLPGEVRTSGRGVRRSGSSRRRVRNVDLITAPEPSYYSEWAGVALMRGGWKRPDEYFATAFHTPEFLVDMSAKRGRLMLGACEVSLRVDGHELHAESAWTELCWLSDDDVDYLEIEQSWTGGWKLQRQIVFARQDRLLFFADAIVPSGDDKDAEPGASIASPKTTPRDIEYESRFPMAVGANFVPCDETNDGWLMGGASRATVLPLALDEWRTANTPGSLRSDDRVVRLSMRTRGETLYAPLLVDLATKRSRGERTWRKLTVAERLQIQPADVAVGYRVQIGDEQWLIYRSLGPAGNRTLLGYNLSHEFLFGQFDEQGEVNPLIEIDAD